MKICHTCQQTYSDDVEFCPRDGARLAVQATETEAQLAPGLSGRFRLTRRLGATGKARNSQIRAVGLVALAVVVMGALVWRLWPGHARPASPEEKARAEHSRSVTAAAAKQGGGVVGSAPPPVPGSPMPGVTGSALSSVTPPLPPPPKSQPPKRIRVSGAVESPRLIFRPVPEYPPLRDGQVIKGLVRLDAVIGTDGKVQELKAISGNPLLIKAAMDAVKNWRYQPTLVNGEAVEVATEIDINFTIAD